jgi:hypothetical protein
MEERLISITPHNPPFELIPLVRRKKEIGEILEGPTQKVMRRDSLPLPKCYKAKPAQTQNDKMYLNILVPTLPEVRA